MRPQDLATVLAAGGWTLDPVVLVLLIASAFLYARGLRRLWRRAGAGSGVSVSSAAAFVAGWTSLAVALVSPLHAAGEMLFSAHMVQHELLLLVAAPLCVLGRPLAVFLWALPPGWRDRIGAAARARAVASSWRAVTRPLTAFVLQSAALWMWHVPALYEASVRSSAVHALQHGTFFVASSIFWWSLLHGRFGRQGYGAAAAAVFATALEGGVLGALIAFARSLWYPIYRARTEAWGLSPFEDQQLAGILMWVPAGLLLVGFGLALFAAWLGEAERRVAWAEGEPALPRRGEDRHGV